MLIAIAKMIFKTFYEIVRLRRFDTPSFQQVQVDVNFIASCCLELAGGEDFSIISGLMNEVIESASNRTPSPN
jgi:hypothetical protein